MTSVRFGNLSTIDFADATGIEFTKEHFDFLMSTRVDKVSDSADRNYKIPPMTWHCFDAPFIQIHCGSKKMAAEVTSIISSYMVDGSFPNPIRIGITHETPPEDVFGYAEKMKMINSGAKVYVGERFCKRDPDRKSIVFFVKVRETKNGNMFIQEVCQSGNGDYSKTKVVPVIDKFKMEVNYTYEVVPSETEEFVQVKPVRKKMREDEVYVIESWTQKTIIKVWDGEPVATSGF